MAELKPAEKFMDVLDDAAAKGQVKEIFDQLIKFLKVLDDAASKREVKEMFEKLVDHLKTFKKEQLQNTAQHSDEMANLVQDTFAALQQAIEDNRSDVEGRVGSLSNETKSDNRTTMRMFEQRLDTLRSEIPEVYDDSEVRSLIKEVRALIPVIPPPFDATDILNTSAEISAKLDDLEKRVDELARRPVGRGGGGTSAAGVAQAFKYIARTEVPTGAIDGINLTYTVKSPIFFVMNFSIAGEVIMQLPNYTIKGSTITFATALPADFSSDDFEIKYIAA